MLKSDEVGCASAKLSGYLAVTMAMLANCASMTCVQALRRSVPDFELNVCRYMVQVCISFAVAKPRGIPLKVDRPLQGWLGVLVLASVTYNAAYFAGAAMLPLSAANATGNVSLMICIALLYRIFLRADVGPVRLTAICVSILGVFFVSQPGLMFGGNEVKPSGVEFWNTTWSSRNNDSNMTLPGVHNSGHGVMTWLGYSLVVLAGCSESVHSVTSSIPLVSVDAISQLFWVSVLGIPVSLALTIFFEQPVLPMNGFHIALILGHCVTAACSYLGTTYAGQVIGPIRTSLVESFGLVVLLVPQYTFMRHIMPSHRNGWEVVGIFITATGVCLAPTVDLIVQFHPQGVGMYSGEM